MLYIFIILMKSLYIFMTFFIFEFTSPGPEQIGKLHITEVREGMERTTFSKLQPYDKR